MEKIINIELLKNPMNWVIVLLMVAIAGLAYRLLFSGKSAPNSEE